MRGLYSLARSALAQGRREIKEKLICTGERQGQVFSQHGAWSLDLRGYAPQEADLIW